MTWLEEEQEAKQGSQLYISLMAFDIHGLKYTNCSSIAHSLQYDSNKLNYVDIESQNWLDIKRTINKDIEILKLRHNFDLNLEA